MKFLERTVKIDLMSLLAIILIIVCVVIIVVTIYSYGEKECISNPVDYANNYSYNYWWDNVVPINVKNYG